MDKKLEKKIKLAAGAAIIVLALLWSASAMESFLSPYKFVSEVAASPQDFIGRNAYILGIIEEGTLRREGSTYRFRLSDGNASLNVIYEGQLPSDLKKTVGITVIGTLVSEDTIKADNVLAKCPSKYEQTLKQSSAFSTAASAAHGTGTS